MIPIRRNLHFRLRPSSVDQWHEQGPWVTQFINAMSLFFPDGERFFIHTVRHYREEITDPVLQQAVTAFIGQEAMHGREHEDYNRLLAESGLPAVRIEAQVNRFLEMLKLRLAPSAQLAITIAQEHFTAIMAELVLTDPRLIAGADRRLSSLWRWHALEEIEHKAVAFDVYQTVMGKGIKAYALRSSAMVLTTAGFLALVLYYQQQLLSACRPQQRWQGVGKFLSFVGSAPGLLPQLARPWLAYFKPGFHPWDHNNHHLLRQMDALVTETLRFTPKAAA